MDILLHRVRQQGPSKARHYGCVTVASEVTKAHKGNLLGEIFLVVCRENFTVRCERRTELQKG
jgi:hypothetical protein